MTEQFGGTGIDVLVCNAGVMALKDQATKDGYDIQMQARPCSETSARMGRGASVRNLYRWRLCEWLAAVDLKETQKFTSNPSVNTTGSDRPNETHG